MTQKIEAVNVSIDSSKNVELITNFQARRIKTIIKRGPKYDLSKIKVPKHFKLNYIQLKKFQAAISSPEGMKVLHEMKSKRSESLINGNLDKVKKELQSENGKSDQSQIIKVIQKIIDTPHGGDLFKNSEIGLSRKEVWDEFIRLGIIKNETI